jgi:hypothetical protein
MRRISSPGFALLVIVAGCAPKHPAALTSIPVPLVSALIDNRGSPTRPPRNTPSVIVLAVGDRREVVLQLSRNE